MSKITTEDDEFEIDDAEDSGLDDEFNFDDFNIDDMIDIEDNREPLQAFASGVIKPFKLQDNKAEIFGTIARNALPKSYGEAFDQAKSLKYEASSLLSEAAKEAAPALKGVKTLAKKLLPTNSKFVPSFISKKVKQFTTEEDEDSDSSSPGYTSYDPDKEGITSTLQTIFGAERIQNDLNFRRDQIKSDAEDKVSDSRFIESTTLQKDNNYWLSRLVNYQDNITDKYLRKSLELQHLSYYALRDILQYSRTGGENTVDLLKGILKNTGLPNEVKVTNSEILEQVSKEHLSSVVSNKIRDKLGNLPSRISENLSREVRNLAGTLGSLGSGLTDQLNNNDSFGPNPFEQQGEFASSMIVDSIGENIGKRIKTNGGAALKHVVGEDRANKITSGIEAGGLSLNRILRDSAATMNRKMDEASYGDLSPWSILSSIVGSTGSNDEAISKKLHDNVDKPATWDVLSRKTLIEIIPGFMSRQLEQLTLIAHNLLGKDTNDVGRVIYSTKQEGFTTLKEEVEDVKKKVKNTINTSTKTNVEEILNEIDPNQKISKEDRIKIGLKLIETANKNYNFDAKDLLDSSFLYTLDEPETAEKVFKESFEVTEHVDPRTFQSTTKYGNSETTAKRKDNISDIFGRISYNVGDYSKVVSDTYDVGNKDVLTEAGILNQYGYIDANYKQTLLRELLEGMDDPRFVGPVISDNLRRERINQTASNSVNSIPSLSTASFEPRLDIRSQNVENSTSEFPFIRRNTSSVNPAISSATSRTALNREITPIDTSLINHTRLDNFIGPRLPMVETPTGEPTEENKTFKFLNNKILRPLQGTIKTRVLGDTNFSEEDLDRFLEEGKNPDKFEEFLTSINTFVNDVNSSNFVTENKAKLNEVIENNKETVINNPLVQSATKKKEAIQAELNNSELVETIKTVVAPTLSEVIKETVRESQKIAREIIYNQEDTTITKDKGVVGRAYDKAKEAIETRNDIPENSKKQRITTALTQAKDSFNNDSVIQSKINNLTDVKNKAVKSITDNKTFNAVSDYLDGEYKLLSTGVANIRPLPNSNDKRYTTVYKPISNRVRLSDVINTAKEEVSDINIPDIVKNNKLYSNSAKFVNDNTAKVKKSKLGEKATKLIDTSTSAIENNDTIKEGKKFINGKVTYLSDSITPKIDSIKNRFIQDDEFIGPPRRSITSSLKDKFAESADDIKNYDFKENPFLKSISDFIKNDFTSIVKEIPTNISDGFTRLTNPESEIDKPLSDFQTNTLRLLERIATTLDNISVIQNTNTVTNGTEQGIPPTLISRATDTIKKSWVGKAATPFIWTGGKALTGAKNFLALGTAVRKITKPVIGTGLKIGFGAIKPIAKLSLGAGLLTGKLALGGLALAGKGLLGGLIKAPGRMFRLGKGVGKVAGGAYNIAKTPLKAGLNLGYRGAKSLTKFTGKTIAKIPGRVVRGGRRLAKVADFGIKTVLSPFKVLSDIYKLGSGIIKAPFKAIGAIKDKLLPNSENSKDNIVVKKLDEILIYLKKAVPIKTVDVESATNDRIGGVNELIRRRANSKKDKADTKIPKVETKDKKENKENTDGLLSDLGDMAKSVGSLIVGFLGTKLASLFGGLGGILSKIPMIGSAATALGFGTGAAATTTAGTIAAGEIAAGGATALGGAGIGSTILGGLGTAATAFATFSNPIGWALLAGATAYAGYKAYKYLEKRSKLENLELLRFLQYGAPVDNTDAVVSIRKLEEEVSDIISIDNSGKPKIDKEPKEIWESYYEIFGCTYDNLYDNKNFMTWFYKRFIPIFVKHKVVLKQISGNADLLDIDNVFIPKSKEIYDFVNRVQFGPNEEKVGLRPYTIMSSPWHDIALSDNLNKINELTESLKNATERGTNQNGENLKSIKKIEPIVAPKKKEEEKIPNAVDRLEQAKKEAQKENEKSFLDNVVEWGKQNVLDKFRDGINSLGRQIGSTAFDSVDSLGKLGKKIGSVAYDAVDWSKANIVQPISNSLAGLIQKAESGNKGYNAYNRGTSGNKILGPIGPRNLVGMTIGEILQDMSRPANDERRLFAVGKYQMIPSTLTDGIKQLKISPDVKYDEKTQELLFSKYLLDKKRPAISAYIKGKNNDVVKAGEAAASEWASIASPITGYGKYGNGNHVSVKAETIVSALTQSRNLYAKFKKDGLNEDDAYQHAVATDGSNTQLIKNTDSAPSLPSATVPDTNRTSPYIAPAPTSGLIPMPDAPSSINLNTTSVNKIPSESTVKTSDTTSVNSKPEVVLPKVDTNISPDGKVNFTRNNDALKDKIVTTQVSEKTIPITDTSKEITEIPKSTVSKIENPMPVVKPTIVENKTTAPPIDLKPIDLTPLLQKQEEIGKDANDQREREINLLSQILEALKKENVKPDTVTQPAASSVYVAGQREEPRNVKYPYDVNRKN